MAEAQQIQHRDIDLSRLSIGELKRLAERANKQIKTLENEQRKEAFKKLDDLAAQLGLTRADLVARYGTKKRDPLPAKYRNPGNPKETWTGRGRKPTWVSDHLGSGGKLEELAI